MSETKYEILMTSRFRKDLKRIAKQPDRDLRLLEDVVQMLADDILLPERYYDHPLHGNKKGFRECHIQPDWLLIYAKDEKHLYLYLSRTGSHSDLLNL